MVKHDVIELEIKSIGKLQEFEYGIDQFKNVYKRLIGTISWNCIFEYRQKANTRASDSKDMSLISQIGIFSFAVDSKASIGKN